MDSQSEPRPDEARSRGHHSLLWGLAIVVAVIVATGVVFIARGQSESVTGEAAPDAVSVTVDGQELSAAVVDGSIKREAAANPQIVSDRTMLDTRGAASAALEELLVREGGATSKVTADQIDSMIRQADSVFPVGAEPPKQWSDSDRERALKDPDVRATVERILYRQAGLAAVLGNVPEDQLTSETGNAALGEWFAERLKSEKVVVTLTDGAVLSDEELVRAVRPLSAVDQTPQTVVGSEATQPGDSLPGH